MTPPRTLLLALAFTSSGALAQSAGDFVASAGASWLDFRMSSATPIQGTSRYGSFASNGTNAQVHNNFTAQLLLTYFVTDNIAVELAGGIPPKLTNHAQGTAKPHGPGGPSLPLGGFTPIATARSWAPTVLLKYYFRTAEAQLRPFIGAGLNYTWFSAVQLHPGFNAALQKFAGPGGNVNSTLSASWNPTLTAGLSYKLTKNLHASASVTYLPLKTDASIYSVSATGKTMLVNQTRITANPLIAFVGMGYRF